MSLPKRIASAVRGCNPIQRVGEISQLYGLVVESTGPDAFLGEICEIYSRTRSRSILAEVVALKAGRVLLMPYGDVHGVDLGSQVTATGAHASVAVGEGLLGRVIDAFGEALDGNPRLSLGQRYPVYAEPINPLMRASIDTVLETGVKSVDTLLTIGRGQRVGVFSGSGVGKSSLLGMIARYAEVDVNVIALVGERGREVPEFLERCLGTAGMRRSVVVAATSDEPALKRAHAAFAATAIAEYFRDQGLNVFLAMDSLTRFAMALREVGLAVGEPPTARGYTPSVFDALPRLLERAGALRGGGSITAVYTVLVEGDDMNDPIADTARAILDGHFVLSRELATKNHYPPLDVLASVSRLLPSLAAPDERALAEQAMRHLSIYQDSKDMVDIGAYRPGSNTALDRALQKVPHVQKFLSQDLSVSVPRQEALSELRETLNE